MEHLPYVLASFFIALVFTALFCCFIYDFYHSKKIKSYESEIFELKKRIVELDINDLFLRNHVDTIEHEKSLLKKENIDLQKKIYKIYKCK